MNQQTFDFDKTYQQAIVFHQQGNLVQAENLYRIILNEQQPSKPMIYCNLGTALVQQGKANEALTVLQEGINAHPEYSELHVNFSQLVTQYGNADLGIKHAKIAIKLYPEEANTHYNLANILIYCGRNDEAVISLKTTIEINPEFTYSYINLGNISLAKGDFNTSKEYYEKALSIDSNLIAAYLGLGQIYSSNSDFENALKVLKHAEQLDPQFAPTHKSLGMVYHISNQLELAEKHYEIALSKNQQDVEALVLLGNVSRDLNKPFEANNYYSEALKLDPQNQVAKENLEKQEQQKISSWHLEMLADSSRNDIFDQAIKKAVSSDSLVLDIGTGSGLLAMMAARGGAQEVVACEMIPSLAQVAQQVVADNKMNENITIINKKSTSLKVGSDIKEKADILVSEILDVGLFGEGVLPTLRHAKENLIKPEARIIPKAADLFGVLIESDHLKSINPVNDISGFDLSAFDKFRTKDEYSRIILSNTPHKFLSEEFKIDHCDFYNIPNSHLSPIEKELKVKASKKGTIHGIVFWFNLHLDDELSISTGPEGEMIHWGQAAYIFNESKEVKEGEVVSVKSIQSDIKLAFDLS